MGFPWIEKCIEEYKGLSRKQETYVRDMANNELTQLKDNLRMLNVVALDEDTNKLYYKCCNGWVDNGHKPDCWLDNMIGGK